MSRVKIRQFGLDEMDSHFKNMAAADQKKIIQRSLKNSVSLMENFMRMYARQTKEKGLIESIGNVTMRTQIGIKVGARVDRGFRGQWGAMLEYGTKERKYFTKSGRVHRTGRIKKYEWFSRAVDRTSDHVNKLVAGEHYAIMQKIMERNVRKNNKEFISS